MIVGSVLTELVAVDRQSDALERLPVVGVDHLLHGLDPHRERVPVDQDGVGGRTRAGGKRHGGAAGRCHGGGADGAGGVQPGPQQEQRGWPGRVLHLAPDLHVRGLLTAPPDQLPLVDGDAD
ncbi:hypothetical protein [Pseudarthrobacter oxydans]|uniref:hypothetical protein n=1 Tax=Pseudarthrobacter oxydans TaxID=1671 RepID=UPI00344FFA75